MSLSDEATGIADAIQRYDIVALAASAGGITALGRVLGEMPVGFPVPLLVVQHLDPRHDTVIAEVLGRRTKLPVMLAGAEERVRPGIIYVAPPDRHLLVDSAGVLTLTRSELVHFVRPSADLLFESVAGAYGPRAIACVLTGTGRDGAMGVGAVKLRGGTVIVQDPSSAEFTGMPEAAVASGPIDFVLPLDEVGAVIRRLVEAGEAVTSQPVAEATDAELEELLVFVRDARGFDFTGYKRSSLGRRIRKRMSDASVAAIADYRDRLETDADEFGALFNTILINVTSFFRDPDCWTYLQREILPELVASRGPDDEIRVWSAGCSSGEEPYSLAILFAEVLGVNECLRRVKIYGTDVDQDALRQARSGQYPARSLELLPAELRDKYFEPIGSQFAFRSDLRRRVIFGRHDITRDAPISRLDLLVCRNTLMYFNLEAQTQIIDRFHFALRNDGDLFLGKAEMLLSDSDRFEVLSMRRRVFRRRPGGVFTQHYPAQPQLQLSSGQLLRDASRRRQLRDLTLEAAPNAIILVDADGSIAMFNDQARDMFGLTASDLDRPFRDLEFSYRPVELRSLMEKAEAERRHVRVTAAERRQANGELQYIDILLQPLFGNDGRSVGVALTFLDTTTATELQNEVHRVRLDLERAYEALQSTNEELETTNEELQSSIEELETTNEELQSTNEELETTNEELESGNEELETMNEEMRIRSAELDEARSFLAGVLASIVAGVVVLDSALRVRSWNRGAEELWGLRGQEVVDQPFFGLDFGLAVADLRAAVEQCRMSKQRTGPVELAAVNRIGRRIACSVTCSPLSGNGEGDGVVLLMEELRPN